MSQTVDSRVVELKFDVAQFEQKVKSTLEGLSGLKSSIDKLSDSTGLKQLAVDANKNTESLNGISSAVDTISSRFSALGIIGVTALQNITNSAINTGKRMISAISIKPLKDGLEEYELQINSVQTIMANTGKDVKTVNAALDELNSYADLTIYKFGDMTKNAGMFTAAGVPLEDTMIAMKGIGNWAAYAGASTQDMSRATYQLGQSLATGSIKLRDWMSIENTGGMAGKKYQQAFMETARAHGVAIDEIVKANGSFRESLSEGWLTSDIFIETMQRFAKDQSMTDAATKVKTFTQLIDTLQEALGTGWAQVWRTVIGDFEEAKALWTGVNDELSGIINSAFDGINKVVNEWNTKMNAEGETGRDVLLRGFADIWYTIKDIGIAIKNAWSDVFEPLTGKDLKRITKSFTKNMSEMMNFVSDHMDQLTTIFKAFFSVMKIFTSIASSAFKIFISMAKLLSPVATVVFSVASAFSTLIYTLSNGINKMKFAENAATMITGVFSNLKTILDYIVSNIGAGIKKLIPIVGQFFDGFKNAMGDSSNFLAIFNTAGVLGMLGTLQKLSQGLSEPIKLLEGFGDSIKGVLGGVKGVFSAIGENLDRVEKSLELWQTNLQASILLKLAGAVGILALAVYTLSGVKAKGLMKACAALEVMALELVSTMALIGKSGILNPKTFAYAGSAGKLMLYISAALLVMAKAVAVLGNLDKGGIERGLAGISILLAEIIAAVTILSAKKPNKMTKGLLVILAVAKAVQMLADAVVLLASLSWKQLKKGLGAITVIMGEILAFSKAMSGAKGFIAAGVGMTIMASAISGLSDSVAAFATLDVKSLAKGIGSIGVLMLMLAGFNKIAGSGAKLAVVGVGMNIVAMAIGSLAKSVKSFGSMKPATLGKGLGAMAIALGEIVAVSYLMKGAIGASVSIAAISFALAGLVPAIIALGKIPIKNLVVGLAALGGTFVVLGGAAQLMSFAIPALLGFSAALTVFGIATMAIGSGLVLIGSGLTSIGVGIITLAGASSSIVAAFATSFSILLANIAQNIVTIANMIGNCVVIFVEKIASSAPKLVTAFSEIFAALIDAVILNGPKIIEAAMLLITTFISELGKNSQALVDGGLKIVNGVLQGISENIGAIMNSAYEFVVAFIDGLAEAIRANAEPLRNAIINLAKSFVDAFCSFFGIKSPSTLMATYGGYIIQGLINGIVKDAGLVLKAIGDLGTKMVNRIKATIASIVSIGRKIASGFASGIRGAAGLVASAASSITSKITSTFNKLNTKMKTVGQHVISGLVNGLNSSEVVQVAKKLGSKLIKAVKTALGIHSPSREFAKIGMYSCEGLVKGLEDNATYIEETAKNVGNGALNAMANAFDTSTINGIDSMNADPVVTPVLDMSNLERGMSMINSLFDSQNSIGVQTSINNNSTEELKASIITGIKDAISSVLGSNNNGDYNLTINNTLTCDGRTIAESSAQYMEPELNKLLTRANRKLGIV